MAEIFLIRHGKTRGNLEARYIGARTDEPLCQQGIKELKSRKYPWADQVFVSPMKRCRETAGILYPKLEAKECSLLRECDFGEFENHNYKELSGNPAYQAWIDSGGTLAFPGGESAQAFQERCQKGFALCVEEMFQTQTDRAALVIHGGTIMSILKGYARPRGEYFKWQIENGGYYRLTLDKQQWEAEKLILSVEKGTCSDDEMDSFSYDDRFSG